MSTSHLKPDRRKNWKYKECKIVPRGMYDYGPHWGKMDEPKEFGDGLVRTRWWRIDFPDKSWIQVATKPAARDYIDKRKKAHPENFDPNADNVDFRAQ